VVKGQDVVNALGMYGSSCGFDRVRSRAARIIKGTEKAACYPKMRPTQQGCAALHKSPAGERHTKKVNLLQRLHHPTKVPSTPALAHALPTRKAHRAPTHTSALFTL
jgi:tryptophan 2,3-dioxygenase